MDSTKIDGSQITNLLVRKLFSVFLKLFFVVIGANVGLFVVFVLAVFFGLQGEAAILVSLVVCLLIGGYFFLYVMRNVVIKATVSPTVSAQELKKEIIDFFSYSVDGEPLFQTQSLDDALEITWASSITYNQLVAVGNERVKMVVRVDFDDLKKEARIRTRETETSAMFGVSGVGASFAYRRGFWLQWSSTFVPSFSIQDNKPVLQIKHLSSNMLNLVGPVSQLALSGGWSLRLG